MDMNKDIHFRYYNKDNEEWTTLCDENGLNEVLTYYWERVTCDACILLNLQLATEEGIDFSVYSDKEYSYWSVEDNKAVYRTVKSTLQKV
jgi:hypothetical protein